MSCSEPSPTGDGVPLGPGGGLPTVVLHPEHAAGLDAALSGPGFTGLQVACPGEHGGVVAAMEAGAAALITRIWDLRFLTPQLRWVQCTISGHEQIPLARLREAGVVVTTARSVHGPAVALHAWALLLAVVRRIGPAVRDAGDRRWQARPASVLTGRTLAVLGLGPVGEQVAEVGRAFGMHVIGTKAQAGGYRGAAHEVFGPGDTLQVCERADALVVCLPGGPGTAGIVGARELDALGEGWLVSVGRGTVIDEAALVHALTEGRLLGAGLDVTVEEPLPGSSPLWDLPDVVLTPHMAWSSDQLVHRLVALVAGNAEAFLGRGPWIDRIA